MEYYERLKEIRKLKKKSQSEIAKILNTTQQQITKYENGHQDIPTARFKTLCQYYNISADYILGLSPESEWPDQEPINKIIRKEIETLQKINKEERSKKGYTDNCTKCTFLYNAARAHMFALAANRKRCLGLTCSPWTPLLYRYCMLLRRLYRKTL